MRVIAGTGARGPVISCAILASLLGLLAASAVAGVATAPVAAVTAALAVVVAAHRRLFSWRSQLILMLSVILFIPIRRYKLPGGLPFDLEAYRLVVALVVLAWASSLLIDRRVRVRRTAFDGAIAVIVAATIASLVANPSRVVSVGGFAIKSLTFFASFVLVYYLVASLVRSDRDVDLVVKMLVGGGTAISFFALVERRTDFNIFNYVGKVIPVLQFQGAWQGEGVMRGGQLRVYGPAEHPIALGAALVMLLPLAIYLFKRTGNRRWIAGAVLIVLATLATGSRTAIVMIVVLVITYARLRPVETKRLWPWVIPVLAAVHVAVPGAIGTLRAAFFPSGGLFKEQATYVRGNEDLANGRLSDIGPTLDQFQRHPVLGIGAGTRIVGFQVEQRNAAILDDQWLSTLLEMGSIGIAGWLWLFVRSVRRCARAAKDDDTPRGWLLTGLAASIAAYGVGMVTFDAFSFIQVTFVFWVLLGLAAVGVGTAPLRRARSS